MRETNVSEEIYEKIESALKYTFGENKDHLNEEIKDKFNAFDFLKARASYWEFPNQEDLFKEYPMLKEQEEYINILWKAFKTYSQEEMADLGIEMIHDLFPILDSDLFISDISN